jgi:hypothetical protein
MVVATVYPIVFVWPATGTSPKLPKRGDIFSPFFFSFWNLSTEVKESFDLYPEKLDSKMEM